MKEWEKKEYTISIYDMYLDDDGIMRVSNVNRNNEVPSFPIGDAWIEGYMQGMNDTQDLPLSYWRTPEYQFDFNLRIGATMKVFFLQEASDFNGLIPHAIFIERSFAGFHPCHEATRIDILEAIEKHRIKEAAEESIDDREDEMSFQET